MDISLVIPTHNRMNQLLQLLDSVGKQELDNVKLEVLVVSNLKDPLLKTEISRHSLTKKGLLSFHETGRIGVNCARNVGLNMAKADRILLLDDDVILKNPLHIKTLLGLVEKNPQAALVGGPYSLASAPNTADRVYHHISHSWLMQGKLDHQRAIHLVGGNTLYNREVLKHFLKFNENISFGGAETELNLKLFQEGYSFLLVDELEVEHRTSLSPGELVKKGFYQGMGRAYHEQVVSPEIWKTKELSSLPHRRISTSIWEGWLIAWYEFFFRVGFRYAKKSQLSSVKFWGLSLCILQEFLSINSGNILYAFNPQDTPYHETAYPSLKARQFYHWFLAHVWKHSPLWRIPWFIKWRAFTKVWIVPWFFKHKAFTKAWLLPWFLKYRAFTKAWIIPWFFKYRAFTGVWRLPWFLRWKLIEILHIREMIQAVKSSYHWFRWNVWRFIPWWRIPWSIKWLFLPLILGSVVCFLALFFPVNTIGLSVPYIEAWDKFEKMIKQPFRF